MLDTVLLFAVIPLAFDVGGQECGLAFSLSLELYYFFLATFKYLSLGSRFRYIYRVLALLQVLVIPMLLIYHLDVFQSGSSHSYWTQLAITSWRNSLNWSTPFFTLLEGFATLLVIQASGQISRYLVNHKSDSWMIGLLVASGTIISWAVYFLWRIYSFPGVLSITDASLIGVLLTSTIILCAYGIGSGRGNLIESSLLFAYHVFCIYETFTDFKAATPPPPPPVKPDLPPLPPFVMDSAQKFASSLPEIISKVSSFFMAAFSTLSPSVCISLAYRSSVLYLTTRIIPSVRAVSSTEPAGKFMALILSYSPCILIGVYTHLLMSHFGMVMQAGIWRWVNAFGVLALYAAEILYGEEQEGLVSDWRTD